MTREMNDVCIPNISLAERRKRLRSGFVMSAAGLVTLIGLVYFGLSRWWRLIVLPLFVGGMAGFFQWRDET